MKRYKGIAEGDEANIRIWQNLDEWGCNVNVEVDCLECEVKIICCRKKNDMDYEVIVGPYSSGGGGPFDLNYFIEKKLQSDVEFNCDEKPVDNEESREELDQRRIWGNCLRVIQQILRDHKKKIDGFCTGRCVFPSKSSEVNERLLEEAVYKVVGERSLN